MTAESEVQEPERVLGVRMNGQWFQTGVVPHKSWQSEYVEVVPREVAERLAEALDETFALANIAEADWTGDHSTALNEVASALAEYRAAFPKPDDVARMRELSESVAVRTRRIHGDTKAEEA